MEKRLSSQQAELDVMRRHHDELQQRKQPSPAVVKSEAFKQPGLFRADLADHQLRTERLWQDERENLAEAQRLQEQLAIAQQESELLLLLLSGKVKPCVDSLASAFASQGRSWVSAPGVARDLKTLQRLVDKAVEALSL